MKKDILNKDAVKIMNEKTNREIRFVVQPTLFKMFQDVCKKNNITVSQSLRDFITIQVLNNCSK